MKRTNLIFIVFTTIIALGCILYFVFSAQDHHQTEEVEMSIVPVSPPEVVNKPTTALPEESEAEELPNVQPKKKLGKKGSVALGFTSLSESASPEKLLIKGTIPNWLSGDLIRTGPALFEHKGGRASAWSDGSAMIHKFHLDARSVTYDNHLVRSEYFQQVTSKGQFGVKKEKKGIFSKLGSLFGDSPRYDNANVNICCIGGDLCAITETPLFTMFDPSKLKTTGAFSFDDKLEGHYACPHPHIDASTGDMYNYMIQFGNTSTYVVYKIPAGTKKRVPMTKINVGYPSYMHSFSMTENYLLLMEQPYRVNPLDLLFGDKSFIETYQWKPKQGTKITVINKHDGTISGIYTTDALFALHHINSFEKGDTILLDVAAYKDSSILFSFDVASWQSPNHPTLPKAYPIRITMSPASKSVTLKKISSDALEMPRINYEQYNGKPYNFVYGTHMPSGAKLGTHIIKLNVTTGKSIMWHEEDSYPGEPVYIAKPDAQHEDDGILLSVVLDISTSRSYLLILDAKNMKELARAELDHHIPFDSHGHFYPSK